MEGKISIISDHIKEHANLANSLSLSISESIACSATLVVKTIAAGGTIFVCGNGGSSSDSQHFVGELVGRFSANRRPLRAIALNSDTAVLTCISNDFGYENIFARQLEGLSRSGDMLIAISSSGNSQNIVNVLRKSRDLGLPSIALLGNEGGEAVLLADQSIVVPSSSVARIQEMHILIIHIICEILETDLNLL